MWNRPKLRRMWLSARKASDAGYVELPYKDLVEQAYAEERR
jgi:hypothetical protein